MKRGFLKTDKKAAPAVQASPKPSKPVPIPVSPQVAVEPDDVSAIARIDLDQMHFRIASLGELNLGTTIFLLYPGTKEAMLEQFKPFKPLVDMSVPIVIKEDPGRGRATFAKKTYNTGDLIFDERPLFVAPLAFPGALVLPPGDYMKMAIDRLPPILNSMFFRLHNCKSNDPQDVCGIVETNALGIGRLPGPYEGEYLGVFLMMSRINHSCVPNTRQIWNPKTFSYYLTALRPIAEGEQIFISYLSNLFLRRTKRQKEMSSKYSFTCTCGSCTLPKDLSARSDVKRNILSSAISTVSKQQKEHEPALKKWIADPSLPDDHHLKPARFLMQLMEEEQAFNSVLWLTQAEIACKALCALGDRVGVVELAQKASGYAKINFFGDDAGWSKVAAAPERTEWWGLRKKAAE